MGLFRDSFWYVPTQTHLFIFIKYTFQYQGPLNFANSAIFLQKISIYFAKIVPLLKYSKQQCESCVRYFLILFLIPVKQKDIFKENISFTDCASSIRLPDCSRLVINYKKSNTSQFADMNSSSIFLTLLCFFFQVQYWFKFH